MTFFQEDGRFHVVQRVVPAGEPGETRAPPALSNCKLPGAFLGGSAEHTGQTGLTGWTPRVDIEKDERQYVVKADLPGVDAKSVDIAVSDSTLTLRGHRKEEREERKKNYHRIERFEGEFYREIPLPRGIDADRIEARNANGVLTITIPKSAEATPKRITVREGKA